MEVNTPWQQSVFFAHFSPLPRSSLIHRPAFLPSRSANTRFYNNFDFAVTKCSARPDWSALLKNTPKGCGGARRDWLAHDYARMHGVVQTAGGSTKS